MWGDLIGNLSKSQYAGASNHYGQVILLYKIGLEDITNNIVEATSVIQGIKLCLELCITQNPTLQALNLVTKIFKND